MRKDKVRLFIFSLVVALLLMGSLFYGAIAFKGGINLSSIFSLVNPLIVVFFMGFLITRRYQDIKQGVPLEDERSKKVLTNAAAGSFYVSLYWILALSWLSPLLIRNSQVASEPSDFLGIGVGGMGLIFFIAWLYYDKKGKLN